MRKIFLCLLFLYLMSSNIAFAAQEYCKASHFVFGGESVYVQKVKKTKSNSVIFNSPVRYKLHGIDLPEIGQNFGSESANVVKKIIEGKILKCEYIEDEVVFFLKGHNINEFLIKKGYAWVPLTCKTEYCNEWMPLQEEAKKQAFGLWGDSNAIAPWEFLKNIATIKTTTTHKSKRKNFLTEEQKEFYTAATKRIKQVIKGINDGSLSTQEIESFNLFYDDIENIFSDKGDLTAEEKKEASAYKSFAEMFMAKAKYKETTKEYSQGIKDYHKAVVYGALLGKVGMDSYLRKTGNENLIIKISPPTFNKD